MVDRGQLRLKRCALAAYEAALHAPHVNLSVTEGSDHRGGFGAVASPMSVARH